MGKIKKQILPDKQPKEKTYSGISKKYGIRIDKNNNPVIFIDDIPHFFTQQQYDAFLKQALKIAKEMNPEIDYTKYL